MEKSHRRASGTAIPNGRDRGKLVAGFMLAIIAAAFLAVGTAEHWTGYRYSGPLSSQCNAGENDRAGETKDCALPAAGIEDRQFAQSSESDTNASPADANIRNSMNIRRQRNRVSGPRAWSDSQINSRGLVPGHTIAELCRIDPTIRESHCLTGNFDELGGFPADGSASRSRQGEKISGHVLTSEGFGLDGVRIVASPKRLKDGSLSDSEPLRFWTVTDSLGAYTLDGLPEGEYTIRSVNQAPYLSGRIDVRTGVSYADLIVSQNLDAIARGQVLTPQGEPIEGVTVLPTVLGQPSVLTDYDGRFRLQLKLKPTIDAYTIRFQSPGYRERTAEIVIDSGMAFDGGNLNIVMHPVEAWTAVNGKISDYAGDPLPGRIVEFRSRSAQQVYKTTTDNAGKFLIPFVEFPAEYQLIVFGGPGHKDYQQSLHVSSDMGELDVHLETHEFGKVSGMLVNVDGIPVPDFQLVLRNKASRKADALVSTDEYGNFEIPAAPAGEFVVASQSTPSILVQGLRLRSGDNIHLPLVLDWGKHEIRGIVLDTHNNPVPASRVILRWSYQEQGITTQSTRRTATDIQGHFAFNDLGPGPHSLRVDAPGFAPVEIDHDLRRQGYDVTVRMK